MGTKGTEIAKLVAEELKYAFYDTEDIEKKAEEMGCLDDVREVNGKVPPPLKRFFSIRPEICLDRLYVVICELARLGSAVIIGRGGNMLFRGGNSGDTILNSRLNHPSLQEIIEYGAPVILPKALIRASAEDAPLQDLDLLLRQYARQENPAWYLNDRLYRGLIRCRHLAHGNCLLYDFFYGWFFAFDSCFFNTLFGSRFRALGSRFLYSLLGSWFLFFRRCFLHFLFLLLFCVNWFLRMYKMHQYPTRWSTS